MQIWTAKKLFCSARVPKCCCSLQRKSRSGSMYMNGSGCSLSLSLNIMSTNNIYACLHQDAYFSHNQQRKTRMANIDGVWRVSYHSEDGADEEALWCESLSSDAVFPGPHDWRMFDKGGQANVMSWVTVAVE